MFKTLIPALSIILAILIFVFFTKPMYADIQAVRDEKEDYAQVAARYTDFNAKVQSLLEEKGAINISDREKLDQLVPVSLDIPRLLVDLEALSKNSGLLFGNVSISDDKEKKVDSSKANNKVAENTNDVLSQRVTFEVLGTYEQFKFFLQGVESSLTLMDVVDLKLTASNGIFQQYSVTVQVYSLQGT